VAQPDESHVARVLLIKVRLQRPRLCRCLDRLQPHRTPLERHLQARYCDLFGAWSGELPFDLTSFCVDGAAPGIWWVRREVSSLVPRVKVHMMLAFPAYELWMTPYDWLKRRTSLCAAAIGRRGAQCEAAGVEERFAPVKHPAMRRHRRTNADGGKFDCGHTTGQSP
jgi:hypothetical protein